MGLGIGWSEIVVILLVALIVLGPTRLPDVAKKLGRTIRELRQAWYGIEREIEDGMDDGGPYGQDKRRRAGTEPADTPDTGENRASRNFEPVEPDSGQTAVNPPAEIGAPDEKRPS